jgi:hypothetical protein
MQSSLGTLLLAIAGSSALFFGRSRVGADGETEAKKQHAKKKPCRIRGKKRPRIEQLINFYYTGIRKKDGKKKEEKKQKMTRKLTACTNCNTSKQRCEFDKSLPCKRCLKKASAARAQIAKLTALRVQTEAAIKAASAAAGGSKFVAGTENDRIHVFLAFPVSSAEILLTLSDARTELAKQNETRKAKIARHSELLAIAEKCVPFIKPPRKRKSSSQKRKAASARNEGRKAKVPFFTPTIFSSVSIPLYVFEALFFS